MISFYPVFWAGLIAFAVIMYVILDGFDLGIGILFPFVPKHDDRTLMMDSIAPVWDGNGTWMVFGAALLYGAFPVAYSTLLPILYIPIVIMLIAMVFRGITFEFRAKAHKYPIIWEAGFVIGSTTVAFCQGLILGSFVQGYGTTKLIETGHAAWLTPFGLMTGIGVVAGYALLGATWLIMKTEGELQNKMRKIARYLLPFIIVGVAIVSIWTPLVDKDIAERWFSLPNFFYLLPMPLMTAALCVFAMYSLVKNHETWPFLATLGIFILSYLGLCISMFPYIVPRSLTVYQAITPIKSLEFLFYGVALCLPLLIGYTAYAYYIFRGKVKHGSGYHD